MYFKTKLAKKVVKAGKDAVKQAKKVKRTAKKKTKSVKKTVKKVGKRINKNIETAAGVAAMYPKTTVAVSGSLGLAAGAATKKRNKNGKK